MLKVNYKAEALQALHTGSDEKAGTITPIRKEKRVYPDAEIFDSKFIDQQQRREAVLSIILPVYKEIDRELKAKNYGFYDAFAGKLSSAAGARTKEQFLTELCRGCGVRTISAKSDSIIKALELFHNDEFLQVVRDEIQYLMLMLRHAVQMGKEPKQTLFSNEKNKSLPKIKFSKSYEWIPIIAANGIRGVMRRLVMRDYLERIGVKKESHRVPKDMYHQLMTGGNITDSTAYEDIEYREKFIRLCPMIGLLGSAIGNMTIQGRLLVSDLRPICKEYGTGTASFWEYISRDFGTRSDTSKTETDIAIIDSDKKEKSANQMLYGHETLASGTKFSGMFCLTTTDPLLISAFWHAVKLWNDFAYVGGKLAVGKGLLSTDIEVPENANQLYLNHIEKVKAEAFAELSVERYSKKLEEWAERRARAYAKEKGTGIGRARKYFTEEVHEKFNDLSDDSFGVIWEFHNKYGFSYQDIGIKLMQDLINDGRVTDFEKSHLLVAFEIEPDND